MYSLSLNNKFSHFISNIESNLENETDKMNNVHNQDKSTDRKYIKTAVILSLGVSQLVGPVVALVKTVKGIWHTAQAVIIKFEQMSIKARLEKHQVIALQKPNDKVIQQEFKKLQDLMSENELKMHTTLDALQHNARHFVASVISVIPFMGVIGAGAFLNVTAKNEDAKSSTAVQKGTEEIVHGLASSLGSLARNALYPLGGQGTTLEGYYKKLAKNENISLEDLASSYKNVLDGLKAKELRIPVDRGDDKQHHIRCQFINTNHDPKAETIVLFHGNGMIGEEMGDVAYVYKAQGKNVMMVTMGGYPGSDEHVATSEISSIQDVNAVLKYLEGQGVQSIGVHGHSIGGTLAMHATQLSDKVKYCCIDKSLDSARNVAANLISNLGSMSVPLLKIIPKAIVRGVVASGFPTNQPVPGVKNKDGSFYTTDGCDNLTKAGKYNGVLVTITGTLDHFMGYGIDEETKEFTESFPHDMHQAHATKNKTKSFDCFIPCGHSPNIAGAVNVIQQGIVAAF